MKIGVYFYHKDHKGIHKVHKVDLLMKIKKRVE